MFRVEKRVENSQVSLNVERKFGKLEKLLCKWDLVQRKKGFYIQIKSSKEKTLKIFEIYSLHFSEFCSIPQGITNVLAMRQTSIASSLIMHSAVYSHEAVARTFHVLLCHQIQAFPFVFCFHLQHNEALCYFN